MRMLRNWELRRRANHRWTRTGVGGLPFPQGKPGEVLHWKTVGLQERRRTDSPSRPRLDGFLVAIFFTGLLFSVNRRIPL